MSHHRSLFESKTIHPIHLDAINEGLRVRLHAFTEEDFEIKDPIPPKGVHAVLWLDDWGRGVELAEACMELVFTAYPLDRKAQVRLVKIALDEVDIRSETLEDLEGSALSFLVGLIDNITLTGDPETALEGEGDDEEMEDSYDPA